MIYLGMMGLKEISIATNDDPVLVRFRKLAEKLKDKIAFCYLFGSRARKDWRPDSDYDILVVMYEKDREVIDCLYEFVMDILLDTGRLISLKILTVDEFNRLSSIPTPFIENVLKEGVRIG